MIRRLAEPDLESYAELRRRSLIECPLAFAASPESDFAAEREALRAQLARTDDWALVGAFDPGLCGAAGLLRARHPKTAHKAHLWGMYVAPEHRRRGLAAALLDALIATARGWSGVTAIELGVTTAASDARRVYERAGFRVWGTEPDALRHDGTSVDEARMTLRI